MNSLQESLGDPTGDPVNATVAVAAALDFLPENSPNKLVNLRKMWTAQEGKIRGKLAGDLQKWIKGLEIKLTQEKDFENARRLLAFRKAFVVSGPENPAGKVAKPPKVLKGVGAATNAKPYENILEMRFVPVPITGGPSAGKRVLFSVWETRVQDYAAFIKRNRKRRWPDPGFKQKDDYPAVNMSWEDAVAFCEWLTELDRNKGKLEKNERYRLPTDHEWSCAVGIGKEESAEVIPSAKGGQISNVYPWGNNWPPPKGAGNYYGEETKQNPIPDRPPLEGYDDGFERTAPVGSFDPNEYELYDMGGNVWEYCEDWFSAKQEKRVLRGAGWDRFEKDLLRSSQRYGILPDQHLYRYGFRVVIAVGGG